MRTRSHHPARRTAITVKEIVEEHLRAEKSFRKRVLASPEASRRFLIRAGIWSKLPKMPAKKHAK
jgi:hypothetical protein